MTVRKLIALTWLAGMTLLTFCADAWAIPAWARKYGTSCATCHEAFPRLNGTGEAFRLNGYRFGDMDEAYLRDEPVSMGDEAYKRVFPESVWPSDIPGLPPIAVRVVMDYDAEVASRDRVNSAGVTVGQLFAAGTMGDSVSFFTELAFRPETGTADVAAFVNLEDLLVDDWLNLRLGSVGMQELDTPNSRNHQRLTRRGYLKNDYTVPYPTGFTETNDWALGHNLGLMAYGFNRWMWYSAGVVNGQGEVVDVNPEKDVFATINFKMGGLGFDGSGGLSDEDSAESDEIPATPSGHWVDNSVRLGGFFYYGVSDVEDPLGFRSENRFWRAGVDLKLKYENLGLVGGVVWGEDDEPYGTVTERSVHMGSWFVEGEYFLYPWLVTTVRYEATNVNVPDGVLPTKVNVGRLVPSVALMYRTNLKIVLEGMFYGTNKPLTETAGSELDDQNTVSIRVELAF